MKLARFFPLLALAALFAACSSTKPAIDFDPQANFSTYKTWNWLPGGPPETGDRQLDSPEVRERLKRGIEDEFAARGFRTNAESPDFYVFYHAALNQAISERNIENYYQYMNYTVFVPWVTSSYTETWDVGTLIIDVFDAKTRTLVWRGTGQTKMNAQAGPRENEPLIRKGIREMLKEFPPK
jgi:Domain of unknown function (DUF4136)